MTTWNQLAKPSESWTLIAKPTRGSTSDGFIADDGEDGFYSREHTDGFLTSDGDWTPVLMGVDTWTLINKPS